MSAFSNIRDQVTLGRIISVNGSGKAHCVAPDHQDNDPSMHLYDDHVHCFVCGFHGDVTDVWAALRGFDRPIDAALDLAREFGIELPETNPEAQQKAHKRREKEDLYLKQARACQRALENHPRAREWWESRGFGPELRERFLLGTNKDGTAAVIPFWHRGRVQGLICRKLEGKPKYLYPKAEVFPCGYRPLFIPGSVGAGAFLVEGIIDALAVAALGESAIALGGTGISERQMQDLNRLSGALYILPDADKDGAEAAREWAWQLFPKALLCSADYSEGGKDVADLFARAYVTQTAEHLERLKGGAQDLIDVETDTLAEMKGSVRARLAFATERIVPLLVRVRPSSVRDATADIVAGRVEGLKVGWIRKAIKEEQERLEVEASEALAKELTKDLERRQEEYRLKVEEARDEIGGLFEPGVLGRLRGDAARMHNVRRDEESLDLALLIAVGAQLAPLPNGRPLGASALLVADAGRGKNHIVDAAVKVLPEEFYLTFEIASGQSLYYMAADDPGFLKHRFVYPNEIEGVEALIEFLRPMLSKGSAKKFVTNKDAMGTSVGQEIIVEGPVTAAIPTVRNKTDEQLQTRLLVAELPDYVGRVKEHSAAISELLLPGYTAADFSRKRFLWREGLRQLTALRRVVFPLEHPDFALDDDQLSHGARLWANLLGLMCAHAWLEQKNRPLVELPSGEKAIEAHPDDYAAAYDVFTKVCKRTVVNLSDTHRQILGGLWDLQQDNPDREGFTQREIKEAAEVSLGAVSKHKAFLVTSAKLVRQTDHGLILVEGAEPSWWSAGGMMQGLPTPEQVRVWWGGDGPPPDPPEQRERREPGAATDRKPHIYAGNDVHDAREQSMNTSTEGDVGRERPEDGQDRVHGVFMESVNRDNGAGKPSTDHKEGDVHSVQSVHGDSGDSETGRCQRQEPAREVERGKTSTNERRLSAEEVGEVEHLTREGMAPRWARAVVLGRVEEELGL
jgi:DNA primase